MRHESEQLKRGTGDGANLGPEMCALTSVTLDLGFQCRGLRRFLFGLLGRGAKRSAGLATVTLLLFLLPHWAAGQSATATQASAPQSPAAQSASSQPESEPTGWIGFVQTQFGASNLGTVIITAADFGYAFTDHLSGEAGVPLIFTRSPFSPVVNRDYYWETLLGEPYLDVKYSGSHDEIKYTSVLTGTVPVSGLDRIYTTGRFGVDWSNHVETQIDEFTPFLNLGASNGVVNRFVMPRPYTTARPYQTLGFLADFEGGAEYRMSKGHTKGLGIGASAYVLVPGGPQKVFSRLVVPFSSLAGDGHHNRYFQSTFETTGPSSIARDNGFSAWLDVNRRRSLNLQFGYTHSVHYVLDMWTVTFTFDGRSLLRGMISR